MLVDDGVGFEQGAPDDPRPQPGPGGGFDVFVQKRGTAANQMNYSYLLGGSGTTATAIALDPLGDIYVAGSSTGGYPVVNASNPGKTRTGDDQDGRGPDQAGVLPEAVAAGGHTTRVWRRWVLLRPQGFGLRRQPRQR